MFWKRFFWPIALGLSLMAVSLFWRNQTTKLEPTGIVNQIEHALAETNTKLKSDARAVLSACIEGREWPSSMFVFHAYDSGRLIAWSNNTPVPDVSSTDTLSVQQSGKSFFLVYQLTAGYKSVVGYLWLQKNYSIQNSYLVNRVNTLIFPRGSTISEAPPNAYPIRIAGMPMFSVNLPVESDTVYFVAEVGWICLTLGVILFLMGSWRVAVYVKEQGLPALGGAIIFLALLLVRLLMVYGDYPGVMASTEVFDPTRFASSSFNNSIGNFFLNSLAFAVAGWVMYAWVVRQRATWKKRWPYSHGLALVFFLLAFGFHLLPFLYLETIFHNSAISLDITRQLYFDTVRWFGLGCFVLSVITAFFYFHAFLRLAMFQIGKRIAAIIVFVLVAALLLYGYHFLTERQYEIPIVIGTVHIMALLAIGLGYTRLSIMPSKVMTIVFLSLLFFSMQSALAIKMLTQERDVRSMKRYANAFLIENDVLAEYLLSRAAEGIERDVFVRQQFSNTFGGLAGITHKIQRSHMSSYFDRYEVTVNRYDRNGLAMDYDTPPLDSIKAKFTLLNELPPNVFLGKSALPVKNNYLLIVPIQSTVPGFVSVMIMLREGSPVTVFPRLLLDDRFSDYAHHDNFSYAMYANGVLQHTAGNFQYKLHDIRSQLSSPRLFRTGLEKASYHHLGLEDIDGRVAIVSIKSYAFFYVVTNFSFFFLLGLLIAFMGVVLFELIIKRPTPLPYSVRIQLYVYLALVLPSIAIAVTTLRLNTISDTQHVEADNMDRAKRFALSLENQSVLSAVEAQEKLQVNVRAIGVDASLFSSEGKLLATSQPEIYGNHILGVLLSPSTLREVRNGNFLFTEQDQVDNLTFRTTYAAVRSPIDGQVKAILSVPFFESQRSAEQDQLRLVSNFLVVVAGVFILFYLASFFALSWLTNPLLAISASLRKTTLTGANRKLTWHSKDEIGEMVSEYNRLIDNLEISKAELARKQREDTWREMARQVAHEIKNPLTPMKLTLQQMQMNVVTGNDSTEKNKQYIKTVLHQVDILSEIASTFSAFAQMPTLKLAQEDLISIVQETVNLYGQSAPHNIQLFEAEKPIWVNADRKMFVRIFGNIILNAFQSGGGKAITVNIDCQQKDSEVVLVFTDNGHGMPPEVVDKIFIPYFSTKASGSGLGLAIARQGIEQAGGRIWCESIEGKGSVFYIALPIVG